MQDNEYLYNNRRTPDPDAPPYARTVAVIGIGTLIAIIAWFALTADDNPPRHPAPTTPALTTAQLNIAEQHVTLLDGRQLTCLVFPSPGYTVSCDWAHSRLGG